MVPTRGEDHLESIGHTETDSSLVQGWVGWGGLEGCEAKGDPPRGRVPRAQERGSCAENAFLPSSFTQKMCSKLPLPRSLLPPTPPLRAAPWQRGPLRGLMGGEGGEQQEPGPRARKREDVSVCLRVCMCVSVHAQYSPVHAWPLVILKTKWSVCGNQMNPLYKLFKDQS